MPVKKTNGNGVRQEEVTPANQSNTHEEHNFCGGREHFLPGYCQHKKNHYSEHFGRKILMTLFGILVTYLIVLVGTIIRNNLQKYDYIGKADKPERTISIQAQGKVTAKPDIALTTMGLITEEKTVADAQQKNTEKMNNLIQKIKALGIDEKDIQTANYNIYPQYFYPENKPREIKGYEIRQDVVVKIRDLTKSNQVLSLAGEVGINNVSGLQFTIDDKDVYLAEARKKAFEKIKDKMQALNNSLGISFVSLASYDEYENNDYNLGMGAVFNGYGDSEMMDKAKSVNVESGSMEVVLNVNVNFEIE